MFDPTSIQEELSQTRRKSRKTEDSLVEEAKKILQKDLFTDKKILENLRQYEKSFECLEEEDVDAEGIFTPDEIKKVAVNYRLKFLDSALFKDEIPYEAVLKIKHLDERYRKSLNHFKILALPQSFVSGKCEGQCCLFAKTNYNNYFLVHSWGKPLPQKRRLLFAPLRSFETLAATVLVVTLCITLSLPTFLITLDSHAGYWSGYRAATFFHLLFFNFGVTAYFTFAFALNFSSSVWNRKKDFD